MTPLPWNRVPRICPRRLARIRHRSDALACYATEPAPFLAFGNGRSYSDVCLNEGGTVILTRDLDRFISFNPATGVLRCEAGILLRQILELVVPLGWFLPVVPGTQYVTLGGAVANDVHGKNHHEAGSFGCHVTALELLRSDGSRIVCTPSVNGDWFAATVGGLGLTGLITWVEVQLQPIANPFLSTRLWRFGDLAEFWALNTEAERHYAYTVAWIDCQNSRGLYIAGKHAPPEARVPAYRRTRALPCPPVPVSLVCRPVIALFNFLYYHRPLHCEPRLRHFGPFFFPLDRIPTWNRLYGPRGFYQYQCVLPRQVQRDALPALFHEITRAGPGPSLAVLKAFGNRPSPGLLSFPRPGVTVALDFPNQGRRTLQLLARLDRLVLDAGGALYPAKDARMPPDVFHRGFPAWEIFLRYQDPHFSSSFWRRVLGTTTP